MSMGTDELGASVAAFTWDRNRSRKVFWVHFPLFVLHVPFAFVIIGLPNALLFGYFALRAFRRWRNPAPVFEIHEHGFVDRRRGHPRRHGFAELEKYGVVSRALRLPFPLSFVKMNGVALAAKIKGRHFYVNEHLADIERCVTLLQEGIVRQRLPAAREALARNETLHFGSLYVNATGLKRGRRVIEWAAIRELRPRILRTRRRSEPVLEVLDIQGGQWDVIARTGFTDPAVFLHLCADRLAIPDVAALCAHFCGVEQRSEEASGTLPPVSG